MSLAAHLEVPQDKPAVGSSREQLEEYREAIRPVYDRAKARLEGTDKEYLPRQQALRTTLHRLIKGFQDDDPATKAMLIMGKLQGIVDELDAPRMIVLQFEALVKQIEGTN